MWPAFLREAHELRWPSTHDAGLWAARLPRLVRGARSRFASSHTHSWGCSSVCRNVNIAYNEGNVKNVTKCSRFQWEDFQILVFVLVSIPVVELCPDHNAEW